VPDKEIGNFFIEVGIFITGGLLWIARKIFGMNSRLTAVENANKTNSVAWKEHLAEVARRNERVEGRLSKLDSNVATIAEGVKHNTKTGERILDITEDLLANQRK